MKYNAEIHINKSDIDEHESMMENNDCYADAGTAEVIETFTTKFADGHQVDLKICNSEDGIWLDPVMFDKNGCEVCVIEPAYSLKGDFIFWIGEDEYVVTVKEIA